MYLKKVEIQGFKSFRDRVTLSIPAGITAVVGPNGCGKSNIADAMRWVLGEQSAKLLRGDRMQDVIFAGTESRKGVGYAQVSMTIDNSEGDLLIDYSEVVITRRVYRSGESEYLINNSACRLMDIHEVFMGTGVGKEGYSIIGQGQIDKILSSKPDDRRNLFEEAAGVHKYKLRKIEAEKKLAKKHDNLVRIQDILAEVESRLESLEEQAGKARKYMDLRDVLREIELNIFIYEADKIERELGQLAKAHQTLEEDQEENNEDLEKTKKLYDEIRAQLSSLQERSGQVQNDIMNTGMTIEQDQGNINLNQEKIKSINETLKRLKADHEKRNSKSKKQKTEKELFQTKQVEIQNKIKKQEVLLDVLENDYESMSNKLVLEEERLEGHKGKVYRGISSISNMKTSIENGDNLSEQIAIRDKQIDEAYALLSTDIEHQKTRSKVLEKRQFQSAEAYKESLEQIKLLEERIEVLRNKQGQIHQLHRSKEDLYHKSSSRYKALSQMQNEYEGYYRSVKNILNLKEKNPDQWKNIEGVVGELITVPKKLEIALDVALGNSIQHIITKDEKTANIIIEHLKKYNLGRATFLPLTAVKGRSLGADGNTIPKEPGVIGFANTLIAYDQTYGGIMSSLLGRVVVVDHMKNAIALAKKYRYRYRIVTLEGEILNPGGSITGGHFNRNKDNMFSRDREVGELKDQIDQYKLDLKQILAEEKNVNDKGNKLVEALKVKQGEKGDLEKLQMEISMEADHLQGQLKQLATEKENLQYEKEEITKRYEKMHEDIHNYETLIQETKADVKVLEEEMEAIQEAIKKVKNQRELLAGQVTDLKVSLSSQKEILRSAQDQSRRIEQEMAANMDENASYDQQLRDNQRLKEEFRGQIDNLRLKIKESKALLKKQKEKLGQSNQQIKSLTLEEDKKRQKQDQIVERNSRLQNELYRVENQTTKINLEKESIYTKVWDKYEVTYDLVLGYKKNLGSQAELGKKAKEYRAKIRGLGIINTAAIEEYDETKERYEFMKGHEEDILAAEETLLELIDNLTGSMEVIFKEQFAKISDNFNIVFTELFGGGHAYLELTDTDDVLESGIEINVQPPGKRLQNMMLLSGGERALTAIAILFGILRLKPSPFAVLDEIEAALDEANVTRFSNYLTKMGKKMQFLIITHRKGTMAVADTIYGVTMEERGVSKVISVQLDEARDYSESK